MQNLLYTRDGKLIDGSDRTLSAMLDRMEAAAEVKLILFAHGGLVPREAAEQTAFFLDSEQGYGPLRREGWETAYFIWHSGVAETVEANWHELEQDPLFIKLVLKVAAWVERRVGRAIITEALGADADIEEVMAALDTAPEKTSEQIREELRRRGQEELKAEHADALLETHLLDTDLAAELAADEQFRSLAQRVARRAGPTAANLDPEIVDRIAAAEKLPRPSNALAQRMGPTGVVLAIQAIRAGFRVLKRYLDGRDHGIGPTCVEEILRALYLDKSGARAWSLMKQDTRDHFKQGRGGALLLEGLARIAATGKPVRLITVGHSAGSILASHLAIAAARLPAHAILDFIFLAPAVRMDEFVRSIDEPVRLDGLRIFTMGDDFERANHLDDRRIGKIYRRSLLYLISGVLERAGDHGYPDAPLLGLQRHVEPLVPSTRAEKRTLEALKAFLERKPDRLCYSPTLATAAEGRRTASTLHGGYYRDLATLESIMHIARRGM